MKTLSNFYAGTKINEAFNLKNEYEYIDEGLIDFFKNLWNFLFNKKSYKDTKINNSALRYNSDGDIIYDPTSIIKNNLNISDYKVSIDNNSKYDEKGIENQSNALYFYIKEVGKYFNPVLRYLNNIKSKIDNYKIGYILLRSELSDIDIKNDDKTQPSIFGLIIFDDKDKENIEIKIMCFPFNYKTHTEAKNILFKVFANYIKITYKNAENLIFKINASKASNKDIELYESLNFIKDNADDNIYVLNLNKVDKNKETKKDNKEVKENLNDNIIWKLNQWFKNNEEQKNDFINLVIACKQLGLNEKVIEKYIKDTKLYESLKEFVNFIIDDLELTSDKDYIYQLKKILELTINDKSKENIYVII